MTRPTVLKPVKVSDNEWKKVSKRKALQYAVLEQIRENCDEVKGRYREHRRDYASLENVQDELTQLADKDLTKTQVNRGHPSKPPKKTKKQMKEDGDDD